MAPPSDFDLSQSLTRTDDAHYTVIVRLPFARGDFVDPPQVDWDAAKDQELWVLLSRATGKGRDLDWHALADRFNVTLSFLSQQSAWLYKKQLSQVRAQLLKVNQPASVESSPRPGSASGSGMATGQAMTRGGSGGSGVPFALSNQPKQRPVSHNTDGADSPSSMRGHPMSRNTSSNTVTQLPHSTAVRSPIETQSSFAHRRQSREASRRSVEASPAQRQRSVEELSNPLAITSSSSSSSASESEPSRPISRSRAFAPRPRYSSTKTPLNPLSDADEEEDEGSTPFLPFSGARTVTSSLHPNPGERRIRPSTKHPSSHRPIAGASAKQPEIKGQQANALHSSSSSAQSQSQPPQIKQNRPPQPIVSALSPRQRRLVQEGGSDGTPSMGSSFSDLDDASVTQSALEEALANEMGQGGVASRMSTISQALRSRYL